VNDVAATVSAMGIDDPTPAIPGNGAVIAHDQPAAESLSATISQYFIGGMTRVFSWHARITSEIPRSADATMFSSQVTRERET